MSHKTMTQANPGDVFIARRVACDDLHKVSQVYEEYRGEFAWAVFRKGIAKPVSVYLERFGPDGRAEEAQKSEAVELNRSVKRAAADARKRKAANKRGGVWLLNATEDDMAAVFTAALDADAHEAGVDLIKTIRRALVRACDAKAAEVFDRNHVLGHCWAADAGRLAS